jgi:hypothetical protein
MFEERSCRFDDELDNQPITKGTMSFFEAWLIAASRKSLRQAADTDMVPPNLVNIYIQVKGGFEDVAGFHAANDEFSITCDKTAEALSDHFTARKMDPMVIEGFHVVRRKFEDPTRHVGRQNMIAHIESSL